jgi:hypothetical protein
MPTSLSVSNNPTFTRVHYLVIAHQFRQTRPVNYTKNLADLPPWGSASIEQWHKDIRAIVRVMTADNPEFKPSQFLAACGAYVLVPRQDSDGLVTHR